MEPEADTQALVWLRALKRQIEAIDKNLDYCIRGQEAGQLSQDEFDAFVAKVTRFAKRIVESAEGE